MVADVLYHYTDYFGSLGIKSYGYIRQSERSGAFGSGVYMTDKDPTFYSHDDILRNNYGYNFAERPGVNCYNRADFVVKIYTRDLDISKLIKLSSRITGDSSRSIYVYKDVVEVPARQVSEWRRSVPARNSSQDEALRLMLFYLALRK